MRVLVVEDEARYAAIVLDVMLPGFDGFELCRKLRAAGMWAPVLMLTARDAVADRVRGLDAGADDYLVKLQLSPKEFALLELFLRHPGVVLTRSQILDAAWDFAYDGTSNVVDQYVTYLRRKVDVPFGRHDLETVRGMGYRLRDDGRG
jgi:two-component system OmpR family response regulator